MDEIPKRFDILFKTNQPALAVCNVQIPPSPTVAFGNTDCREESNDAVFSLFHEVEMFNTYHGQWVPMPSMPKRRAGSAAAVLDDGRMMVIGG